MTAKGLFAVKLLPQQLAEGEDTAVGRLSIDKQFHGDLEGTSKGVMITASGDAKGSAGYVALERVTATLAGRTGTFILQHSGTMTRGTPQLTISVVPDSGTNELRGLSGLMSIEMEGGRHAYEFQYTFGGAQ